jgi:hypothetical protein
MAKRGQPNKPVKDVQLPADEERPDEPVAVRGELGDPEADQPEQDEAEELELADHWVFMIDPAWEARTEDAQPPAEAVVGGWYVDEEGVTGLFQPNPDYEPSEPDLPTDPVDAAVQLVVRGDADGEELINTLQQVLYGVALDEEGNPVVAPAPDDVLSVLVTTAPAHRSRVNVESWAEVTMRELAEALPDEGVDVLLNPGAPASMRLLASIVKESVGVVPEPEGAAQAAE